MKRSDINHKLRDIIVFFTYTTEYLTEIRLVKLIYLAEIYAIEKFGERLTNIDFISHYYGPYSDEILSTGEAIAGEDITIEYQETTKGPYGSFFKTTKEKTCVEHLTKEELGVLKEIARKYKFKPTTKIVKDAKETEPYLKTEFGDAIDLDEYTKEMDLIYRNENLLTSVKQSMVEAQEGKGVLCTTSKDLEDYFDSL